MLTKFDQITVEDICEAKELSPTCAYVLYETIIHETGIEVADTWLLGFLHEKDTLVAWFGDQELGFPSGVIYNHAWEYHGMKLVGLTASEALEYYREHRVEE